MLSTPEYMKMPPWEALIRMINDHHSLALTPETTELIDIQPISRGNANTQVTVVVNRSNHFLNLLPPGDVYVLAYTRVDMESYLPREQLVVDQLEFPTTTADVVDRLSNQLDVVFGIDDVIHYPLDTFDTNEVITLKAHPRSLRWQGECQVTLKQLPESLESRLSNRTLDALYYPSGRQGYITGSLYCLPLDFSAYRRELIQVSTQGATLEKNRLIDILAEKTQTLWVIEDNRREWNIAGVSRQGILYPEVVYNGVVDATYTPRTDVSHVLVLQLSTFYCTNIAGQLLIHYNA